MSAPFGEGDLSAQPPVVELSEGLRAAEAGVMPALTSEALLARLGLDGEEPDGRAMMDRLAGEDRDFGTLRRVVELSQQTVGLIRATNEYAANDAQEAWAKLFGTVVTTQITREGDICPGARELALTSTRDDIIAPEVRAALEESEEDIFGGLGDLPPHMRDLVDFIFGRMLGGGFALDHLDSRNGLFSARITVMPLDEFLRRQGLERPGFEEEF